MITYNFCLFRFLTLQKNNRILVELSSWTGIFLIVQKSWIANIMIFVYHTNTDSMFFNYKGSHSIQYLPEIEDYITHFLKKTICTWRNNSFKKNHVLLWYPLNRYSSHFIHFRLHSYSYSFSPYLKINNTNSKLVT
jgi:hypothetical protein